MARHGMLLRSIWFLCVLRTCQGWRLNVEANRFVTTLQDHFREQAGEYCFGPLASPCVSRADEWAFDYVGMQYLQQMKEAFDEDGSGYITVREVNRLIEMLPDELDWR